MTVNDAIAALIALRDAEPGNGDLELDVENSEGDEPAARVDVYLRDDTPVNPATRRPRRGEPRVETKRARISSWR